MGDLKEKGIHSELLLTKIMDTTSLCIFWKDEERRFVGVNRAFLDFYGFPSQDVLIGKTDEDMGWHSDPDPFRNDEWRVLKQGESTTRVHGRCMVRGEEHDILASKSPIYENGKIIGLVGTFEDVTQDYRQRDVIRKLTETMDHIPCGICICRIYYGHVICSSANEYFLRMVGGTGEDFNGKDLSELEEDIHPEDWRQWERDEAALLTEGRDMDAVYRYRNRKTGTYFWLRIKGCRARLSGDEEFIYYTFTNENELKNSENRETALRKMYASSVDAARLVVWEYDVVTHTVTFDQTGYTAQRCRELGLPPVFPNVPEALYKMLPAEYHTEIRRFYQDVFDGKPYSTADVTFRPSKNQLPLYLHLSYTTVCDSSGNPIRAYGTSQDMSREKAAQLQYERELDYINTSSDKVFIAKGHHDLTANRILGYFKADRAVMDVSGMTYDQAYESLKSYIFYESDRQKYLDLYKRENLISRFHNGDTSFRLEYRRIAGIYSAMWVTMEVRTFQNPENSHIECFIYSYDSTEKQIRLQMTNNLRSIGYESVGLISIPDGGATYYAPTDRGSDWGVTTPMTDYEQRIRQIIESSVPPEEQGEALEMTRLPQVIRALEENGDYGYSCSYMDHTDHTDEIHRKYLHFSYLDRDHSVIAISLQDITEQYRKEQQQILLLKEAIRKGDEANRAKSDFLSRMSHDIRTPMNGIIGMTYLAKQEPDPAKIRDTWRRLIPLLIFCWVWSMMSWICGRLKAGSWNFIRSPMRQRHSSVM